MSARATCGVLALCLLAAFPGCSTTFTTLNVDRKVHRLRITSETPGAVVLLDGKTVGQTPTEVAIPYQLKAERIHSGKYKAGWAILGAGLGMVAAGVAMTGGGVAISQDGRSEDDGGKEAGGVVLAVFGVGIGLTGLASLGIGTIALATSDATRERTVVEPATTVLEVRLPGGKRISRRFAMSPAWPRPRLGEVGRVHVFDRRLALRDCEIHVTGGPGARVGLAAPGKRQAGPTSERLALPCQVRRLAPLAGFYSPTGRALFTSRFALRLGKKGPWHEGKLTLSLMLKTGGKRTRRGVTLQAREAWDGQQISASVGTDKAKIHYNQQAPAVEKPVSEPEA